METESSTSFSYKPPPGGDIILKSTEGTTFLAHSLLLGMASSVFAGMISTATQRDVVELSDDAESISLMLRFIYPPTFLQDLPLALVEKSLRIAQKYDVSGIITSIDHLIMFHPANGDGPVHSETIRMFCLASIYGLPNTRKATAMALRPGQFCFEKSGEIVPLAQTFPTASTAIGLLGSHCVQGRGLWDLLFGDELEKYLPVHLGDGTDDDLIMCSKCFEKRGYLHEAEMRYEPGWLVYWAVMAFGQLTTQPFDQCTDLFDIDSLSDIEHRPGVCHDCIEAARTAEFSFREWAIHMRTRIISILHDVELLYQL
ncbi:The BTB (BR-C, ttk and bab)/POZ (Pox virus and Zinc finger) domain [Ceratobasidium sp. AG-Ba]|nr:The BTB (BR-C, ttk and bab)/POZ (Pox virus and Zinc finger) domain [Ceratobasidium sp. AG-Ba]